MDVPQEMPKRVEQSILLYPIAPFTVAHRYPPATHCSPPPIGFPSGLARSFLLLVMYKGENRRFNPPTLRTRTPGEWE